MRPSGLRPGRLAGGVVRGQEVLEVDPRRDDMLTLLARSEARQGLAQTARAIYQRLDPRGLQGEDYFLVGRGLIAEGHVEEEA